ncbi:P-loop containing nucleoside triphosphate hydrolase protein [Mycena metata]|uniref:P-loop containing nucleoside triphosphate hydrolase protein n=1 Tax=Mycena metata TaxID=1033252 RepID=A0AAD7ISE3_9AGAR|nr:P-loop containing nucleoside triphosphate hydrolase protein [Mycena metata]
MDIHSHGLLWLPTDSQHPLYEPSLVAYASSTLDDESTKTLQSYLANVAFFAALFALSWRTFTNRKLPRYLPAKPDVLVAFKTLFALVYIAGTAALLVHVRKGGLAEWVLPTVAVATAIAFASASISEHYHSIAPSTLTALYAVLSAVFYVYTFWDLRNTQGPAGHLYAVGTVALSLFVLIFLESANKRNLLIPTDPAPAYESTISFFAKPFFPHIVPLLFTGAQRRLTLPELRDIPHYLRSDPATEKLLAALAIEDIKSNRYLVKSTFRAFTGYFLSPVVPRLLMLTCTFAQVTLVEAMVSYVADKSIPKERGYGIIAAYFLVYVSQAISSYVYSEKVNAFIVLYRSALTGALYAKTIRLTSMAARELGQGAATTYMSVDVEKATSGFQTLQTLWAAVVTIVVACAMLWAKAGYVMFAPLLFIVTLIFSTSTISQFVGAAQKAWLNAIDARIKLLTSVLNQLLPIKLGAYEVPLAAKVNALRALEAQALGRFISFIGIAGTLSNIGGAASFVVTLAAYAFMLSRGLGNLPPLDVSQIFTLYTIVNVLHGPLNSIGQSLPQLFAAFASLARIQGFLQLPEKAETAEPIGLSAAPTLVDVSIGDEDGVAKASAGSPSVSLSLDGTADEVALEGCTFTWEAKDLAKTATATTPVLKDITLKLVPRKLHMVVGSVASGKSSLLMSILGETTLVEGTVKVDAHRIALASQTAFIYPGTLRANILLDSEYDEEFYEQVIHACALRQDIELLPRRDMTKLGDKGSTLSGGQRQRLAIARAVYARADLVLLDDVFSALDGETEAHVFASLFGPEGMLRGKTTVLVTHGVHHLPSADRVIIMDAGTITHFGSFEEVRDAGATFALASTAGDSSHDQVMTKETATAATITDEELDEELNWNIEQSSKNGAYTFYMKCTGLVWVGLYFTLIVLWSSIGIFSTAYLSMLASSSGKHLALWVLGYAGIVTLQLSFMGITLQTFGYILSRFTAPNIHGAELSGVMGSPVSWITKNPVGKVLNRFSQDIQVADQEFPFAFLNFAVNVLGTVGTFVFIVLAAPLLGFAIPVLLIGGAYFLKFYLATSKQFRRLESASKSPLYTLFGTTVTGLITVRAYGAQSFFRAQNAAFVNESQGAMHHRVAGQLFLQVFLLWFQTILACSVAVLTVWFRDQTDAAFLGIALSRLVSLGMSLTHVLTSYASVENGAVAIERIAEFARLPEEEKEMTITADYSAWPSKGSLAFADFSMKYREDLPLALKNISFDLKGGLKIGICGRTGSGKSSTVLALFRGIDQHLVTGKIVIDGVDISTVPMHHVRESMSIVTQDPFLWHGSIRENLDVTNERTDSEIWETLKLVEMYDAVSALEDKLDHLVVDEESFSKGQRQLLCLARALLRRRKIIVLDESTSSMDHITDEKIRHVVDTQMKDLTVLAIAHRISTIVNYDKILVLDSGSIAEFDDPKVLLANPESRFARLAATQGIYHPDLVPKDAAVKELSDGTVMVVTEDLVDV